MVGPAPKAVINKDLTFYGAPLRGAHWFDRMKALEGQEIVQGAQKLVDHGGK